MSWAALQVEPACMGKAVGEAGRPIMLCGARLYIITFEYTILMDEPDRNLDIDNIMDLYNVLSFHKPQTQIIAVIYNPALIYKLSKLDHVNFIEMTKGYLKKVVSFMNKNK